MILGPVGFVACLLLPLAAFAQDYNEPYRPQYHFSPAQGWIGDPDGLIRYQNTYHLFWWGHAISDDLVHWKELPTPMRGDDGSFAYFSGSVVVDCQNTSRFGCAGLAQAGNIPAHEQRAAGRAHF